MERQLQATLSLAGNLHLLMPKALAAVPPIDLPVLRPQTAHPLFHGHLQRFIVGELFIDPTSVRGFLRWACEAIAPGDAVAMFGTSGAGVRIAEGRAAGDSERLITAALGPVTFHVAMLVVGDGAALRRYLDVLRQCADAVDARSGALLIGTWFGGLKAFGTLPSGRLVLSGSQLCRTPGQLSVQNSSGRTLPAWCAIKVTLTVASLGP